MRAMRQQFTNALEGLTRQNTELQNELNQSRHKHRTSLQHSDRKSEVLHCMGRRRRESVWGRVCWRSQATSQGWKTRGETGARCSKGYAGAAIPRLEKLMDDTAKAATPIPNATILEEKDRAASTQLHWMMLTICNHHRVPGRRQRRSRGLATTDRRSASRR